MSQLRTVASVGASVRRCVCVYVFVQQDFSFDQPELTCPGGRPGGKLLVRSLPVHCDWLPIRIQPVRKSITTHSLMLGRIPISRTRTNHLTVFTVKGILQLHTSQAEATPTACHNQD